MQILLVEDNSITADVLANKLRDQGHSVYFVGDGLSALTYLAAPSEPKPNLILIDYHLPGMNGDELLCRVHGNPSWCGIPTIVLTAGSSIEQDTLRHTFPGIRILSKPFHFDELLNEVKLLEEMTQ